MLVLVFCVASKVSSWKAGNMKTRVRVLARLHPGWWRVVVAPHNGLAEGGIEQDFAEEWIPAEARFPNCEFWIDGYVDGKPRIISGPEAKLS